MLHISFSIYRVSAYDGGETGTKGALGEGKGAFPDQSKPVKGKPFLSPITQRKVQDILHRRYMNVVETRKQTSVSIDMGRAS